MGPLICTQMDKKAVAEDLPVVMVDNLECSVCELHSIFRRNDFSKSYIIIHGSCRIQHHEGDIVQDEPEIRLKQLTVKANMSSQSLQALLAPLAADTVKLRQCIILDANKQTIDFAEKLNEVAIHHLPTQGSLLPRS